MADWPRLPAGWADGNAVWRAVRAGAKSHLRGDCRRARLVPLYRFDRPLLLAPMIVAIQAICAVMSTKHVARHQFAPSSQTPVSLTSPYSVPIIEVDLRAPVPRPPLATFGHGQHLSSLCPLCGSLASVPTSERVQITGHPGSHDNRPRLPTAPEALADDANRQPSPERQVAPGDIAAQTPVLRTLDEHCQ